MHTGWTDELAASWQALDISQAPPFLGEFPLLGPALAMAGIGDLRGARALYGRLSPATGWQGPPAVWLHMHALRIALAAMIGEVADLPPLVAALEAHRSFHITSSGGVVSYDGPVELWLGIGAAGLHEWERAVQDLTAAGDIARGGGTPAFAVHADVECAAALIARALRGDAERARSVLLRARPEALRLGMPDFLRRIDDLLERVALPDGPLSPRELEVAALVAAGHTNKQIASDLFVSERTAQNHVQHILTKLGLANRTQVASWYREQHPSTIEPA
jgi:DNA-binding CsgD family transcriptional regulator